MHHTKDNHKYLTTTPIPRLILQLSIPTIISMLASGLYNMVDTYFVSKLNTQSIAAVGIAFSFMTVVQALGYFFGQGTGNFISRRLGALDDESANRMAATGFYASFVCGVVLMLVGLIWLTPLCKWLGSTATILPYTEDFMRIILIGTPFMMASMVLNNQMRFKGNAMNSMYGILLGVILNCALDPLFIFVLDMGVAGAALATVTSQIASFALLWYLDMRGSVIRIRLRNITTERKYYREIMLGGLPSLFRQGLGSVAIIMLNITAALYGDAAIAGMSIVTRLSFLAFAVVLGLGQSYQPVCGFNYGAAHYDRVIKGFWFTFICSFVFLVVISTLGIIYAREVIHFFQSKDPEVVSVGISALRWQFLVLSLNAWVVCCNILLQTIGKSVRASLMASARQGLFFIPILLLFNHWFHLSGVEMSQAAADFCTFLMAIPITVPVLRELKRMHQERVCS